MNELGPKKYPEMDRDPLQLVSVERWPELQTVFLSDWPRSLPGYTTLEVQLRYKTEGFNYGFNVYSLFGDMSNGFVAINNKVNNYEVIIQYPKDDTDTLEKALKQTELINWNIRITLAFSAPHVLEAVQKVIQEKDVFMDTLPSHTFIIEKGSPLFEDLSLPPGFTFRQLSSEYVNLIDMKWPHRYPHSTWYFKLLIDTKSGYGLFKNGQLLCWIFIGECGQLTHLYTLEEYRKQGLGELILKLFSNELLKSNRQVYAFCVKGNYKAYKLYKKMEFKESNSVCWGFLYKKSSLLSSN